MWLQFVLAPVYRAGVIFPSHLCIFLHKRRIFDVVNRRFAGELATIYDTYCFSLPRFVAPLFNADDRGFFIPKIEPHGARQLAEFGLAEGDINILINLINEPQ